MLKQILLYLYKSNLNDGSFVGIFLLCLRHFQFCFVAKHQDILTEWQALCFSRGPNAAAAARRAREFPASSAPVQLLAQAKPEKCKFCISRLLGAELFPWRRVPDCEGKSQIFQLPGIKEWLYGGTWL